jgi:hypothetical protein
MNRTTLLLASSLLLLADISSGLAADVSLSGQVSSAKDGAMEGVLVSAKKEGSTITNDRRHGFGRTVPFSRRPGLDLAATASAFALSGTISNGQRPSM